MGRIDLFKGYDRLESEFNLQGIDAILSELVSLFDNPKGNTLKYTRALEGLPDTMASIVDLDRDAPMIGVSDDLEPGQHEELNQALTQLCPWRKGPFEIFGIDLDAEWQSNIKWNRFASRISLLKDKLKKVLEGVETMGKLPGALFIVDIKKEDIAVQEAHRLNIPVFAIVDTNCDPDEVDYLIPANDDAVKTVEIITQYMADAVIEGDSKLKEKKAEEVAEKERVKKEKELERKEEARKKSEAKAKKDAEDAAKATEKTEKTEE